MAHDRILSIDETKLIGSGSRRQVYVHPEDATKVLKIYRADRTPALWRARRWYGRFLPLSRFDPNGRDYAHYRRLARRASGPPSFVCRVFGCADTTLGPALVAERIRDADGATSETLRGYVANNGLTDILPAVEAFFEALAEHHVTVEDPNPKNIVVRRTGTGLELVVIDGLGDPTILPYKSFSKRLNRRKLMLKKGRLFRKLRALVEGEARSGPLPPPPGREGIARGT